jgi:hypothetical protein
MKPGNRSPAERGDNAAASRGVATRPRWPSALRRGPMELAACVVIAAGILMLLQPFALALYTWSFLTMLAGVVLFTVVARFPP